MAKIRNDYEHSWWPRLLQWLEDGSTTLDDELDRDMTVADRRAVWHEKEGD